MSGISMSAMGLKVVGGRNCADGVPHEVPESLVEAAATHGAAEGRCVRCKEKVRIESIQGD